MPSSGAGGGRRAAATLAAFVIGCAACGVALGATGWVQPTGVLDVSVSFRGTNQANTSSVVLTLNHDIPVTLRASAAAEGSEVLTHASSDFLDTAYKLTGAALGASADANWVNASDFILPSKVYSVEDAGQSDITLWVRGTSAAERANDAGPYSASIILTVTW